MFLVYHCMSKNCVNNCCHLTRKYELQMHLDVTAQPVGSDHMQILRSALC